ncbi:AMP-binding protein, partial [Candidatus Gottesmanbacteria bacterium]|nr:AMP-binding protein [Candidatus Gottesmanbacteria bacterium]
MKPDTFKKRLDPKNPPNLHDYDEAFRSFDWKLARKELEWFDGTKINAAYNAIDRHTHTWRKNKIALYWEDEDGTSQQFTFEQLSLLSNKLGNILKDFDVNRGDRVFIFLPRVPELFISFLGTLKIGAIAGTLF